MLKNYLMFIPHYKDVPYGNSFIIFKAMTNGHIHVNGVVYNHCISGHEQELRFENEFNQTYLREFVNEIDNATSHLSGKIISGIGAGETACSQ